MKHSIEKFAENLKKFPVCIRSEVLFKDDNMISFLEKQNIRFDFSYLNIEDSKKMEIFYS